MEVESKFGKMMLLKKEDKSKFGKMKYNRKKLRVGVWETYVHFFDFRWCKIKREVFLKIDFMTLDRYHNFFLLSSFRLVYRKLRNDAYKGIVRNGKYFFLFANY